MSEFHIFSKPVEARFAQLSQGELYVVDVEDIFGAYLAAFPEGSNPIFKTRTVHDCSCCKNFVRNLGAVIGIKDGQRQTVWDVEGLPEPFATVAARMHELVMQQPIKAVFRTKEGKYGTDHNYSADNTRWDHFVGTVASRHRSETPDKARGDMAAKHQVMGRGLRELKLTAFETVLDLISANALYRGEEHKGGVEAFRDLLVAYEAAADKELFVWDNLDHQAGRIRNTAVGTLLIDLSEGVDLEAAVRKFEVVMAPQNYKRPTALITPKQIDDAIETLRGLGLESAIDRRFARISDVSVNNVLFVDRSVRSQMRDALKDTLMDAVKPVTVDVSHAQDITVDDFLATVVPQAQSIDVLVKNAHLGNFVSLTAPVHADAGRLFGWDNPFAWSYDGDVADSVKERVKRAGGNIHADVRVSLSWGNFDDLDIHALMPDGRHVYFSTKWGILDVDMNAGGGVTRQPVENLAFVAPRDGIYKIWVHQFAKRENTNVGFQIEVEAGGSLFQYAYQSPLQQNVQIPCFELVIKGGALLEVRGVGPGLVASSASVEKWGVHTETLVPVNTIMASPNHWDGQGVGNRHLFFLLKGCANPGSARGFYNEFLRPDFEPHRKVFETLGSKMKCPPAVEQLSGVGFSSTRSDVVTVVVKGPNLNRAFNVVF